MKIQTARVKTQQGRPTLSPCENTMSARSALPSKDERKWAQNNDTSYRRKAIVNFLRCEQKDKTCVQRDTYNNRGILILSRVNLTLESTTSEFQLLM